MKTNSIVIMLCMVLLRMAALAQGENHVWTMGRGLGLDFNTVGGPSFVTNSISTWEGCASVCDASGNLLFYSDGLKVYDRSHTVMPNGAGLLGHISATQGVAIAKLKESDSLYFLFTLTDFSTSGTLRYSVIDMRLNGGFGDVDTPSKNIFLRNGLAERMAMTGECGKQWLLVQHRDSNLFYAYPIDTGKTIASPVRSVTGYTRRTVTSVVGELKVAPDLKTIALAVFSGSYGVNLFDFDNFTGIVSNYRVLDSSLLDHMYGVEFSPNSTKLYVGIYSTGSGALYQYDLAAGSPALIKASKYTVASKSSFGMRLGPDQKVYVIMDYYPTNFSRVRAPDIAGALCDFQMDFLPTAFANTSLCMGFGNNCVPSNPHSDTLIKRTSKEICAGDSFSVPRSGYKRNIWFDGDTSVNKTFSNAGTYWVYSESHCGWVIDSFFLTLKPYDTTSTIKLDTSICLGAKISVTATDGRSYYKWGDGDTRKEKLLHAPNSYIITSGFHCSVFIDSYKVNALPFTFSYFRRDTSLCVKTPVTFYCRPSSDSVKWSDGKVSASNTVAGDAGKYWVKSYKDCQITIDTFSIKFTPGDTISNNHDTSFCQGKHLTFAGRASMENYLWSTGDTTAEMTTGIEGTYWVAGIKGCDLYTDTFNARKIFYTAAGKRTDTVVCFQAEARLVAPATDGTYLWSNGSTQRDTTVYSSAKANVTITDSVKCTILRMDYTVLFLDFINRPSDTSICNGDTVLLNVSLSFPASYYWNTGDTAASLTVTQPGIRVVSIQAKGCSLSDTIVIAGIPMDFSIGSDRTVCDDEKLMLKADIDSVQYLWSTGETGQSIEVSATGKYGLTITKGDCTAAKSIDVRFVNCDGCIAIPNAFSPNGDGINDRFKPILNCPPGSYQFTVMNRWGQEVFSSGSPNEAWDGSSGGSALEGNVYYYLFKVRFESQGDKEKIYKGDVTLIR